MGSREEDVGMTTELLLEMDSGEKRLNELGYKQELRREMVIYLLILFIILIYI